MWLRVGIPYETRAQHSATIGCPIRKPAAQQTRHIHPMFEQCWPTVYDGGPLLVKHWVDVSCCWVYVHVNNIWFLLLCVAPLFIMTGIFVWVVKLLMSSVRINTCLHIAMSRQLSVLQCLVCRAVGCMKCLAASACLPLVSKARILGIRINGSPTKCVNCFFSQIVLLYR